MEFLSNRLANNQSQQEVLRCLNGLGSTWNSRIGQELIESWSHMRQGKFFWCRLLWWCERKMEFKKPTCKQFELTESVCRTFATLYLGFHQCTPTTRVICRSFFLVCADWCPWFWILAPGARSIDVYVWLRYYTTCPTREVISFVNK